MVCSLAAAPAWAQSSSQQAPAKPPTSSAPSHWGYYEPKPAPQPAQQAAAKPAAPAGKTTSRGGDTSGNHPPLSVSTSQAGGGAGGAGGGGSQLVTVPGINGGSRSLVDQDTETVKLDDKTTRTTTKIYGQGPDGNRQLIAIEQTDKTDLGGGKSKSVSTRTDLDANGNFDLTKRQESETVPTGPNSSVTNTTVYQPGINGALAATQKIQQMDTTSPTQDRTKTSLSVADGNGGWTPGKVTDTTVNKQGKGQQTQDEKTYTPNADGNLTLTRQVVTRNWKAANGQEHEETDTYGTPLTGTIGSGALSLMQRTSTVKTTKPDGTIETREQTEQRSIVSPEGGLQITGAVVETATPTAGGKMATQTTVFADDGNHHLQQISVFGGEQPAPQPAAPAAKAPPAKTPPATKAAPAAKPAAQKKPSS
jgi:hypothetical protein